MNQNQREKTMYRVAWTSNKLIYAFWGAIASFFTDIHTALIGLLICLLMDTVTGFWAAPYRGQKRHSHCLARFVKKLITYLIAVILMHVLEMLVFPDYAVMMKIQLARLICTAICLLEIYSTLENLYDITGLEIFKYITQFSSKKVKEATGVEITKEKQNESNMD